MHACGAEQATDDLPPEICREPGSPSGDWYDEVTEEVGLGSTADVPPVATSVVAADVDSDGWIDFFASVFPSQREPDPAARTRFLFLNRPDPNDPSQRIFVDTLDESGLLDTRDGEGGRGITTVTFGDLDLIVGTGLFNSVWISENLGITTSALHVYRNEIGQDSNWTRIRVTGAGKGASNRSGIGAVVSVTAGGRTQVQEVLGSWGHSNTQTDTWLTFGLGDACTIASLEIQWPGADGAISEFADVRANYPLVVTEGESQVTYVTSGS